MRIFSSARGRAKAKAALLTGLVLLAGILAAGTLSAVQARAQPAGNGVVAASTAGEKSTPEGQSGAANEQEKDENEAYLHSASVKWIGAKMGMSTEAAATVFQVANFAVLALVVVWFLVKTLPKVFRDRSSAIQKQLVDARTATEAANARMNSVEDRLSKLDGEIAGIKAQAEQDSAADELRIKASVEEEKQKILAAAEQEIAAATSHAQRQLQQYAAELAIEQAARKLVVSAETDRLLVQNFARRLGGDDSKEGQN